MIGNISFINDQWFWQITSITLIIWLVFIWKERSKSSSKKIYINSAVSFIALSSLALIALRPVISSSGKSFKAVILTKDFNSVTLDSLKKTHKKLTVYNYKENQVFIPEDKHPETVFILGNGLQHYDLWQLDSINTTYLGGNQPKGISEFKYDTENTVGNDAIFKGRYLQPNKAHKILLEDPAGRVLDSVILTDKDSQEFQLSTNLKVKGELVYQLVEKDSADTIIKKDPLPLTVKAPQLLNILIVNASPSFETKYLKNYLAEAGHKVLVRSRLTKDRYKYEYFNINSKPTISFTQEQLASYDLVIIDASSLSSLSTNARKALETSVTEDGLGMFIQPDTNLFNTSNRWHSFHFTSHNKNTVALDISPKNPVPKYPFIFKDDISIESILNDNSNIISAYKRLGMGRIGTSVLQNTYELQLKGNSEAYKQLWTKITERISKKDILNVQWSSNTPIAYLNEPFDFELRTNVESPLVNNNSYPVPIKRDIHIKSLWNGRTYPKEIGWNTLKVLQDTTRLFKYYVTDTTHWQSLKTTNIITSNRKYFSAKKSNRPIANTSGQEIPPIWFFVVFVLCMSYLWLEPKL